MRQKTKPLIELLLESGSIADMFYLYERLHRDLPYRQLTRCPKLDVMYAKTKLRSKLDTRYQGRNEALRDYLDYSSEFLMSLKPQQVPKTNVKSFELTKYSEYVCEFFTKQGLPYIHAMPLVIAYIKYIFPKGTEARARVYRKCVQIFMENVEYKDSMHETDLSFTTGRFGTYRIRDAIENSSVESRMERDRKREQAKEHQDKKLLAKAKGKDTVETKKAKYQAFLDELAYEKENDVKYVIEAGNNLSQALLDESLEVFPAAVKELVEKLAVELPAETLNAGIEYNKTRDESLAKLCYIAWSKTPYLEYVKRIINERSLVLSNNSKVRDHLVWNVLHLSASLLFKNEGVPSNIKYPAERFLITQRGLPSDRLSQFMGVEYTQPDGRDLRTIDVKSLYVTKGSSVGSYDVSIYAFKEGFNGNAANHTVSA